MLLNVVLEKKNYNPPLKENMTLVLFITTVCLSTSLLLLERCIFVLPSYLVHDRDNTVSLTLFYKHARQIPSLLLLLQRHTFVLPCRQPEHFFDAPNYHHPNTIIFYHHY